MPTGFKTRLSDRDYVMVETLIFGSATIYVPQQGESASGDIYGGAT